MSLLEDDSGSLLYTGDFKLRPGLSAEPCEPRRADILVMETTFGRPEYVFPPNAEVMAGIVRFCREALDHDEIPVLLGYSLGKSQEVLSGLTGAGLPIMLNEPVARLTRIYESFGRSFPAYLPFDPRTAAGHVVLAPPGSTTASLRRRLGRCQVAVLTGWAVTPGCHFRYQADAAFPLSDHADFLDLVEFVKQVAPSRIYTLHGFAADFAAHLRRLGFDARALGAQEQLELPSLSSIPLPGRRPEPSRPVVTADLSPSPTESTESVAAPDMFLRFAQTCEAIGRFSSKLAKGRCLAEYLAHLEPDTLATAVTWFTGVPFASTANQTLSVGSALLRLAVSDVAGVTPAVFRQVYLKHSDSGETAAELFSARTRQPASPGLTLTDLRQVFEQAHRARGPIQKRLLLSAALDRCGPTEARFLVKILTGDLRIGLKEGLVEEAVAQTFQIPAEEIRSAHQILGDLGETARRAKIGQLGEVGLTPFRPLRAMLASPEPDAAALMARVAEWAPESTRESNILPPIWLEDKYDGIRCQLHKVGDRIALFSRDLKEITETFPELTAAARRLSGDVILDGEVVAMDGDRVRPFGELQRRLGRRELDLFLGGEIPVRYLVFDLLWADGTDWLREPLARRRAALEAIALPEEFRYSQLTPAGTAAEIDAGFAAARARGNEGLMIKNPSSPYTPGRRGLAWLKLKRALATLDCVVVGAEYGQGKRKGILSDYTFAIRDQQTGGLKIIGKAYSGLTNEELSRLTTHFLDRVVCQQGRLHEVVPDLVLEIAFDSIQRSARHNSGLSLRFPRIVRIREDKTPADIDTLATARRLAGLGESEHYQRFPLEPLVGSLSPRHDC